MGWTGHLRPVQPMASWPSLPDPVHRIGKLGAHRHSNRGVQGSGHAGHRTLRGDVCLGVADHVDDVECHSGPIGYDQRLAIVLDREELPKRASVCLGVNTRVTVMPLRAAFWPSL